MSKHLPEDDVAEQRPPAPEANGASDADAEVESPPPAEGAEAEGAEAEREAPEPEAPEPEALEPEESADAPVEQDEAAAVLAPGPPEPEEPIEDQESGADVALEETEPSLEEVADAEGVSTLDVEEPASETVV